MPNEAKPSNFFLSRFANFIFVDLLNNMFDVDFMEPIKEIETKEKEIVFYDSNNFTVFSKSIKGEALNETGNLTSDVHSTPRVTLMH